MRRFAKLVLIAAGSTPVLVASGVLWYALSEPPVEDLPLGPGLSSVESSEGRALLSSADSKFDYAQLAPHVVAQSRRAFCGPATISAVLNAALEARSSVTQRSLFAPATAAIKGELALSLTGMTLSEVAAFFRAYGMHVEQIHAGPSGLVAFRHAVQSALDEPRVFVVVNYDRRALQQAGAGHISPLGAYDPATDRVLVMDVAKQKYPYTWVPVPMLWDAMNSVDADAGTTRGYLLVHTPSSAS